jgi:threonine/homoserine/homoserine lactone efflux protein
MAQRTWFLFLAVSLGAVLTPGPAMLAILGHALARGARATLPVVFGNVLGAIALIGASIAGLSALLSAVPHALEALKWLGAGYLLWLGIRAIRAGGEHAVEPGRALSGRGVVRGLLIALSNPKALLFFGAILPQFVDPGRPTLPQFATMALTFALLELAATGAVTFAAQSLAPVLRRRSVARGIHRAGGAILIGAAALVALAPVMR